MYLSSCYNLAWLKAYILDWTNTYVWRLLQMKMTSNGRWLQILKVEYHLSDQNFKLELRWPNQTIQFLCEDDPQWKQPQNTRTIICQQPLIISSSYFKHKLRGSNRNWKTFEMKTTSNERQPQNIKSGITQQPLIVLKFKHKLLCVTKNQDSYCIGEIEEISSVALLSTVFFAVSSGTYCCCSFQRSAVHSLHSTDRSAVSSLQPILWVGQTDPIYCQTWEKTETETQEHSLW